MNTSYIRIPATLINLCTVALQDAVYDALDSENTCAVCTVDTPCGSVVIETDLGDDIFVTIKHNDGREHKPLPLLEDTIALAMPLWDDIEAEWKDDRDAYDQWDEHGFSSELDYMRYRYG